VRKTDGTDAPGQHLQLQNAVAEVLWFGQNAAGDVAVGDQGILRALDQRAHASSAQAASQRWIVVLRP
jgi:hypothetical protein